MKKIKISSEIRDKYIEMCWRSSAKCDSLYEIDYKIQRAIDLGTVVKTYPVREVQYHNLRIKLNNKEVIDIEFNEEENYPIDEYRKYTYDQVHGKVLV